MDDLMPADSPHDDTNVEVDLSISHQRVPASKKKRNQPISLIRLVKLKMSMTLTVRPDTIEGILSNMQSKFWSGEDEVSNMARGTEPTWYE